jgi:hypothetical protein
MAGDAVSGNGTTPGEVRQALPWLEALETVLADPHRLVALLLDAEDDAAAIHSVAEAFGLSHEQAQAVLDNQFGLLVQGRRARVSEELRILRSPWQEPLAVELVGTGDGRADLLLYGEVHPFSARSTRLLLDAAVEFLRERVVEAELRPVVLATGLDGRDPVRVRIWPSRSTEFEYADD